MLSADSRSPGHSNAMPGLGSGAAVFLLGLLFFCAPVQALNDSFEFEGYRVFIGPDKIVDWIDLCCKWENIGGELKLVFADYSPIVLVEATYEKKTRYRRYKIKKAFSEWELSGYADDVNSFVVKRLQP